MPTMKPLLMIPLFFALGACEEDDEPVMPEPQTLVEVTQSVNTETGEFSTLLAAVTAAGLVDELSADGQLTVFAPTDAAFAELGLDAEAVAALPAEDLQNILLYHVATGRYAAADVVQRSEISAANGGTLQVRVEGGAAYVNDALIVQTDVEADNGIIHVIDAVLMPG